jgi:hypothetical protein
LFAPFFGPVEEGSVMRKLILSLALVVSALGTTLLTPMDANACWWGGGYGYGGCGGYRGFGGFGGYRGWR